MARKESEYVADCNACGRKTTKPTLEGEKCPSCSTGRMHLRAENARLGQDVDVAKVDAELLDILVNSPRQIMIGGNPPRTLREVRDSFRRARELTHAPDKPHGAESGAGSETPLAFSNDRGRPPNGER